MQTRAVAPPESPGWSLRYARWQRRLAPYLFISPFFVIFVVFGLFPTLFSLYLSFQSWSPIDGWGAWRPVGLKNYAFLLSGADDFFNKAVRNTVLLALLSGIPQHLIAIPLAFVIHRSLRRLQSLVTAVYFAPYITSAVAITTVFFTLYQERSGVFNWLLGLLNGVPLLGLLVPDEPVRWLGRDATVKPSIAILVIWRYTGWNTVLYLAGLQAIPKELYEAAEVDGANRWHQFRFVTLPLLKPIAFFAVTLTIIGNMQLFVEPYMLVNQDGGVNNSGLTSVLYLWKTAFVDLDMGFAAAMAWILFAAIIALTVLNNRLFGRGVRGD